MADDEWMMGHRGSEWLALAPDLEEDLALSSTSQDEMGHAKVLYDLLHDLGEPSADYHVYFRPANRWHHARVTALPKSSWAEWVVRRYFYEMFDQVRRSALERIPYPPLVGALKKMDREEAYHADHARSLMDILAHGGAESYGYLREAITDDWAYLADLFEWIGPDESWASWDVGELAPSAMRTRFESQVHQDFAIWGIYWPEGVPLATRKARHHDSSPDLPALLDDMREVRNQAAKAHW
ncbi:MAG: phenylacetate-CoA oxygenase subunit PaaI [Sulfobacillus acidophilus]|uniref:Phenylacetate-CoA oxygenase subunit PaaI n=1 Tax=Sulfobacillus acidophilus TaxID=53633 RepID=A0A2T2WFQ8_9FIRM|nr:MAG: phenylacetate-CoA oxygenase subunit PaaI [Sulfobacillus acidophilus]